MTFLRNTWYVAAWADEVKAGSLFHRRILGQDVLIYRAADGEPVAIADRCPHRFAPLHLGKLCGEVVQCPYHGLQFDRSGACISNPHGPVPGAAR
ncbi:MAG TPA: Rieske 2Fe-2S domain-containing protein, partial [Steroidobacteraceae bacterium]|nr:Rieske 2Fe-2S domain-containing protein [Steroidobacteraceae bacterium]